MQMALFDIGFSLETLPAAMRNASGWKQRTGETQCSWCGWREVARLVAQAKEGA